MTDDETGSAGSENENSGADSGTDGDTTSNGSEDGFDLDLGSGDGNDDELDIAGLSDREHASLDRARGMATVLDESIPIPGTGYRVGVDPLLGLLPVSGDLAAAALSLYVVAEAAYIGAPLDTLARMVLNIAIDTGVGSIPVAGDLFDAVWKANERNVSLLESHLEGRTEVPIE